MNIKKQLYFNSDNWTADSVVMDVGEIIQHASELYSDHEKNSFDEFLDSMFNNFTELNNVKSLDNDQYAATYWSEKFFGDIEFQRDGQIVSNVAYPVRGD